MSKTALYKVAYDEAVRALSEQQTVIDSLRSRTGVLFSAAAITTSFLGARSVHSANWNSLSWAALATFVGVVVAFLATLWPRHWEFAANPHVVIRAYIESAEPVSIIDLHRELALHVHGSYQENRGALQRLVVCFQIANVLFAVELMLWIAAAASIA